MKLLLFLFLPCSLLATNCTKFEFRCGGQDNKCIPLNWKCDNVADCQNGEDEQECVHISNCQSGYMVCDDGSCVAGEFKCDGERDCLDGSDEQYCTVSKMEHNDKECTKPRMRCSSGQCIAANLICDGYKDCADGEDEMNCKSIEANSKETVASSHDHFNNNECRDGFTSCRTSSTCIPNAFICDGSADCEDSSDEKNCDLIEFDEESDDDDAIANCIISGQFQCQPEFGKVPKCIPLNATCNGIKECPMGDDESSKCLDCTRRVCDHWCTNRPNGAKCQCRDGYILDHDGVTCIDVDECAMNAHKCQHFCEDRVGSFICQCAIGYRIEEDGYGCRLENDELGGSLLMSIGSEIRSASLVSNRNGGTYSTIQKLDGQGTTRSIDFDRKTGNIYLTIAHQSDDADGELAVITNGTLKVLRENMAGIGYIAIDTVARNIFVTQKAPARHIGISVCKMNGMFCRWIIRGQDAPQNRQASTSTRHHTYRGLVAHSTRGILIWIEASQGSNRIMMANMDGSEIRVLVDNKLYFPSALAIDHVREDVYFGDVERRIIERINLNTRDRRVVISKGVFHPFDMAVFNGFIYWTDWGSEDLKVEKLTSEHSSPQILHTFSRFPYGLSVNHSMYSREMFGNPCEDIQCPWICVMVPSVSDRPTAKCICPDEYTQFEDTCLPPDHDSDQSVSHIGSELMDEYCDEGIGCWNGGSCRELLNEHGRKYRIECECLRGYDGLFCERRNPQRIDGSQFDSVDWFLEICMILIVVFLVILLIHAIQIRRRIIGDDVGWPNGVFMAVKNTILRIRNMIRNSETATSYQNPAFEDSRETRGVIWENGQSARYLPTSDDLL